MLDFHAVFGDANPWLAAAVTLLAGLVRGFAGFGSAMLMAPIFVMLFGSTGMVVTVTAIEVAVSLQLWPGIRKTADWRKIVLPLGLSAALAMPLGLWLLASLDKGIVLKVISAIIVLFVASSFLGWSYRGRRHMLATLAVGAVSGVMMGATSIGGPPVLIYLLAGSEPPEVHRANIIGFFLMSSLTLIAVSLASGVVGLDALARGVALFPMMVAGAWIGGHLFRFASPALYRNVALILLLGVGLFGLIK